MGTSIHPQESASRRTFYAYSGVGQPPDMSAPDWIHSLQSLAQQCKFEKDCCQKCVDSRLLDVILIGLCDTGLQEKLNQELNSPEGLSLAATIQIVHAEHVKLPLTFSSDDYDDDKAFIATSSVEKEEQSSFKMEVDDVDDDPILDAFAINDDIFDVGEEVDSAPTDCKLQKKVKEIKVGAQNALDNTGQALFPVP